MTVSITSPVTGVALTGLTSPTHTLTADTPPDTNAKQYVVTTLGGTQTNVRTHSVSDPFSITVFKPKAPKALPNANPVTGLYGSIPKNTYTVVVRKGVFIDSNQTLDRLVIRLSMDVPAGSDASDAVNIRSALSLLFGVLYAEPNDFGDLAVLGIL